MMKMNQTTQMNPTLLITSCFDCVLCQNRTLIVNGEGAYGKIMFIGEAPGSSEDKRGRPFIGNAGKQLDVFLDYCNFTRSEHYYITNVVKCRPPANRIPTEYEIIKCNKYLVQEIKLVKAKLFVLLGNTALQAVFNNPKLKISDVRGRWLGNHANILATYHPSYIVRQSAENKKEIFKDYDMIVHRYRELVDNTHKTKYEIL
jgi:uracil-DNA glycosylase family 4